MRATAVASVGAVVLVAALVFAGRVSADEARIRITLVTPVGIGATIGTIRADDSGGGVRLTPLLKGLAPGPHAISIHANGDCGPAEINGTKVAGGAAGGIFVPTKAEQPGKAPATDVSAVPSLVLTVDKDGIARRAVTAPGLRLEELQGRAIVIEGGAPSEPDKAKAAGEAGVRVACGVIP
ncbi:MAG: superoxide dismutase family protein [Alphaproteobacteria bacterium]